MKYLRLTLRFSGDALHPVHEFIDRHDGVERDLLLHGNTATDGWDTFLFYVDGEREPYEAALESAEQVVDYDLTSLGDGSFYAYLKQEESSIDDQLFGLFSRTGIILVPPVEFVEGGRATLTALGDPEVLQSTLDDLPPEVSASVERIGEYDGRQAAFDPGLTDRQREAAAAAVDRGYYAVPRECGIEDVAAALDCSTGTAAEHLRKAERNVMCALVELRSF
ncbi:helix-turn-helix domain-containing protein [Candidatus Halobonum tyrrellensis]|uniref:Bacterio-opsin activator HTH domain protein n=1 Tax=Candidatus Halobonum tyrrellensis G22 TaxID=1324957 RepID=V4J067_9EURY|nr:helix-turn-helix domain-containing protein [Candidatus Halobonum tyrrellensis]ESP88807.1 Bacterio-opsin activator HTH domain protein [Candidatus Halobonum tyrrellensis G22]